MELGPLARDVAHKAAAEGRRAAGGEHGGRLVVVGIVGVGVALLLIPDELAQLGEKEAEVSPAGDEAPDASEGATIARVYGLFLYAGGALLGGADGAQIGVADGVVSTALTALLAAHTALVGGPLLVTTLALIPILFCASFGQLVLDAEATVFDAERGAQGIESMPPMLLSLSVAGLALSVWAPGGLTLAVPSWLLSAPLWCAVLLLLLLRCLYHPSVPAVRVALEPAEACDMPPRVAPPSPASPSSSRAH